MPEVSDVWTYFKIYITQFRKDAEVCVRSLVKSIFFVICETRCDDKTLSSSLTI